MSHVPLTCLPGGCFLYDSSLVSLIGHLSIFLGVRITELKSDLEVKNFLKQE